MQIKLGHTYSDRITGFTGIATGVVTYLTGCNQVLLAPACDDVRKQTESAWIDVQRVAEVEGGAVVTLDNTETPGADKPAPIR